MKSILNFSSLKYAHSTVGCRHTSTLVSPIGHILVCNMGRASCLFPAISAFHDNSGLWRFLRTARILNTPINHVLIDLRTCTAIHCGIGNVTRRRSSESDPEKSNVDCFNFPALLQWLVPNPGVCTARHTCRYVVVHHCSSSLHRCESSQPTSDAPG